MLRWVGCNLLAIACTAILADPGFVAAQDRATPDFAGTARPGPSEATELPLVSAGDTLLPAVDFTLKDLGGGRVNLYGLDAPVIILHFWTKSRQCEDDLKALQKLHERYRDFGVRIIGLAYNSGPSREDVRNYVEKLDITFPTLMCTYDVAQRYDVATYPTTFALDSAKRVRYWMYGILVPEHWDTLIREMLAAQDAGEQTPN